MAGPISNFTVKLVELDAIDARDRTMAISPSWCDVRMLQKSIAEIGLQTPLVVSRSKTGKHRIICGFRRFRVVRQEHWESVPCRSIEAAPAGELFLLQFWENLAFRTLSEVEKARAVERLTTLCGLDDQQIVKQYLSHLDCRPDYRQLRRYREIDRLDDILQEATGRGLALDTALLIGDWPGPESRFLVDLVDAACPGRNRQRVLGELLRDLRKSEGLTAPQLWESVEGPTAEDLRAQPGRLNPAIERLRRRRYPQLSRKQKEVRELVRRLDLPAEAGLAFPPYFEGDRVKACLEAASAAQLRRLALGMAEAGPELDEIFELL